ncbi:phosphatidyl-N-methylethanolamine N-methyltransferase [Trichomonascus vanleenenianus]|uniref:bifunctional phosphatidyl-N-methylethanolamine N-methyltransferase/phosphatidyl-N-dimethylethanolamine N-methyltransferase n=1 Tax=Trichomonascus vanleenenianus TaxID=2268995 RepID=UPI003ECAF37C
MEVYYSQAAEFLSKYRIDITQPSFQLAAASIVFNPTYWNIVARAEYSTKILTKLAFGNRKLGCYLLAISIFSLGILRDYLYEQALRDQLVCPYLEPVWVKGIAAALFAWGNILVLTSMWALGVTGTYLGDYFGILMDHRVTSFPFNVSNNPMYHGSAMSFLGTALWFGKPSGVLLTVLVYVMYSIALKFEEPFTAKIYARRDAEKQKKAN